MTSSALVEFARDLVAIPTENPPGTAYAEAVERISIELTALGIEFRIIETGTELDPRHCLVTSPSGEGPLLYLHGHYDVVPAFSRDQFEPRVERGTLTGRGASDMKGGLAAMIYAAADARERGLGIALTIVPDEETGGRLGAEQLAALGVLDPAARGGIAAEPTWGTIWHASRGAYTIRVTVRGTPAHVGLHYEGVNAFEAAVRLIEHLRPLQESLKNRRSTLDFGSEDPRARESIMLVGGVSGGGTNFNIVPDEFSFTIDRRPNPDEDYETSKRELLAILTEARASGVDLDWEVVQDARNSLVDPQGELLVAVAEAVEGVIGDRPSVTCCPGVLETRIYDSVGIPAVAFGPGLIDRMHRPDEDVPIQNLAAAAEIYVRVAESLAGSAGR